MGLKDFSRDLKMVTALPFPHLSEIQRSGIGEGLSFDFTHHALQTPVTIQMLAPDAEAYPESHFYVLFVEGDCTTAISSALERMGKAIKRQTLADALTTLSQRLPTQLEPSSQLGIDASTDNEHDEPDIQDDDDVFDSDQYDMGDDSSDPGGVFSGDSQKVGSMPRDYAPKAALSTMSALTLKRELVDAQSRGIAVSIYNATSTHGTVVSLALPVSKLTVSTHALEAWGLDAASYIVLLVGIRGSYPDAAVQIKERDTRVYTEYRLGHCTTVKPSRHSVASALGGNSIEDKADEQPGGSVGDFEPVYMSKAIEILLNEQFLNLVCIRQSRRLSWDQAQVYLVEFAREISRTSSGPVDTSSPLGPEGPITDDLVTNPGRAGLNLALLAFQLALFRLEKCSHSCMICFRPVEKRFEALKPSICGDALCFYYYNHLGIGVDIEREVIDQPYVVDMLVSFFCKAVQFNSLRHNPRGLGLKSTRTNPSAPSDNEWLVMVKEGTMRLKDRSGLPQDRIKPTAGLYFQLGVLPDGAHPRPYDPLCRLTSREGNEWSFEVLRGKLTLWSNLEWHAVTAYTMTTEIDDLGGLDQLPALIALVDQVPSVLEMREYLLASRGRKLEDWPCLTSYGLRLLTWIVATNRSYITQDSEVPGASYAPQSDTSATSRKIQALPANTMQFRFAQGSPEKESAFRQSMAAEFPMQVSSQADVQSLFAWHGSPLKNWHSILRSGLDLLQSRQYPSGYGGVYLSSRYHTSVSYAQQRELGEAFDNYEVCIGGWRNSQLGINAALAICEVIKQPSKFVRTDPHFVIDQVDWIQCRYLILSVSPTQEACKDPYLCPTTRVSQRFLTQDPALVIRGLEDQPIQIPDYLPETQEVNPADNTDNGAATSNVAGLGDNLDVALPTSEAIGTKRRLSEDESLSPNSLKPVKLDNTSHQEKEEFPNDTIMRTFVAGTLDHASLPRLPAPTWASPLATSRLLTEIREMESVQRKTDDIHALGWYIDFANMPNMYHWIIELHSFNKTDLLAQDMAAQGISSIVLEVRFGSNHNMSPPFIRVVRPRFLPFAQGGGGHVTEGGAICSELLTASGWSSAYDMQAVILSVRVGLTDGERPGRLCSNQAAQPDYAIGPAVTAYKRAARIHEWQVPADLDQIATQD